MMSFKKGETSYNKYQKTVDYIDDQWNEKRKHSRNIIHQKVRVFLIFINILVIGGSAVAIVYTNINQTAIINWAN